MPIRSGVPERRRRRQGHLPLCVSVRESSRISTTLLRNLPSVVSETKCICLLRHKFARTKV